MPCPRLSTSLVGARLTSGDPEVTLNKSFYVNTQIILHVLWLSLVLIWYKPTTNSSIVLWWTHSSRGSLGVPILIVCTYQGWLWIIEPGGWGFLRLSWEHPAAHLCSRVWWGHPGCRIWGPSAGSGGRWLVRRDRKPWRLLLAIMPLPGDLIRTSRLDLTGLVHCIISELEHRGASASPQSWIILFIHKKARVAHYCVKKRFWRTIMPSSWTRRTSSNHPQLPLDLNFSQSKCIWKMKYWSIKSHCCDLKLLKML